MIRVHFRVRTEDDAVEVRRLDEEAWPSDGITIPILDDLPPEEAVREAWRRFRQIQRGTL